MRSKAKNTSTAAGSVRIIGGQLRGSKLPVLELEGLRPSSDRGRETLFNWLRNDLAGSDVLDLFAGSGALGFEACSRGAARAVLIEQSAAAAQSLRETAARLSLEQVEVGQFDAIQWLKAQESINAQIIFVDPPFASALAQSAVDLLQEKLRAAAKIYVELAADQSLVVPASWRLLREGRSQQAKFRLFSRD